MIQSRGKCEQCADATRPPGDAVAIGDSVVSRTRVGRGHYQTDYSFRQCPRCGSLWVTYEDSGAGGHGTFHKCLTASLF